MTATFDLASTVALELYPINDLSSPAAQALVAVCKDQLSDNGLCLLPGFIADSALLEIQREANFLLTHGHYTEHWRGTACYSGPTGRLHAYLDEHR